MCENFDQVSFVWVRQCRCDIRCGSLLCFNQASFVCVRWYRCDSINRDLNEEGLQGIKQQLTGSSLERITCTYDDDDGSDDDYDDVSDNDGEDENYDDGNDGDDDYDDNHKW